LQLLRIDEKCKEGNLCLQSLLERISNFELCKKHLGAFLCEIKLLYPIFVNYTWVFPHFVLHQSIVYMYLGLQEDVLVAGQVELAVVVHQRTVGRQIFLYWNHTMTILSKTIILVSNTH
jgi:hypothetical protein